VGSYERQAAQVDWVVTKPFDRSQIVEMAQEVLRRRDPARRAEAAAVAA